MNQHFIETLRSYASGLESNPITDEESHLCVTIDGECQAIGDPLWIQLHAGMINFSHIDSADKDETLGAILDAAEGLGDVQLEPGSFVTFMIASLETVVVDRLIIEILRDYFEAGDQLRLESSSL